MFIELTEFGSENKAFVNLNRVDGIVEGDFKRARLLFYGDYEATFNESYDQVKELIKNEVAAERGY